VALLTEMEAVVSDVADVNRRSGLFGGIGGSVKIPRKWLQNNCKVIAGVISAAPYLQKKKNI